ncbi:MAG: 16S rRNA processing protein RimM [Gemmatimonadaceae bacterium]|nr:16S rRNA processing protein RimM [Gemmatimonadaceae bacterium]
MRRAHGVRGAWAIEPMTDAPDVIFASGAVVFAGDRNGALSEKEGAPIALTVVDGRPMNKEWLVRVAEVLDRDVADLWRGRYLLVDVARIPEPDEDEVYVFAMIGMDVHVEGKGSVGVVRDVYDAPQGLLLEVETLTGRPLVPWHPGIIAHVDEKARIIVVKPLEGLLE